jgi:hypothetical protein
MCRAGFLSFSLCHRSTHECGDFSDHNSVNGLSNSGAFETAGILRAIRAQVVLVASRFDRPSQKSLLSAMSPRPGAKLHANGSASCKFCTAERQSGEVILRYLLRRRNRQSGPMDCRFGQSRSVPSEIGELSRPLTCSLHITLLGGVRTSSADGLSRAALRLQRAYRYCRDWRAGDHSRSLPIPHPPVSIE